MKMRYMSIRRPYYFETPVFWWSGGGWSLGLPDGTKYLLPENYNGKALAEGAPYEMRSPQGLRVQYMRDGQRHLRQLISPGGRTISLEIDQAGRITEAHDDAGRRVSYLYDAAGRLLEVREDGALAVRYAYDDRGMLAVFDGAGKPLVQNCYTGGRLSQQTLADGKVYNFRYILERDDDAYAVQTVVALPDQSHITLNFRSGVLLQSSGSPK